MDFFASVTTTPKSMVWREKLDFAQTEEQASSVSAEKRIVYF